MFLAIIITRSFLNTGQDLTHFQAVFSDFFFTLLLFLLSEFWLFLVQQRLVSEPVPYRLLVTSTLFKFLIDFVYNFLFLVELEFGVMVFISSLELFFGGPFYC